MARAFARNKMQSTCLSNASSAYLSLTAFIARGTAKLADGYRDDIDELLTALVLPQPIFDAGGHAGLLAKYTWPLPSIMIQLAFGA